MRGGSWGYGTLRGPGGSLPPGRGRSRVRAKARFAGTCPRCKGPIAEGEQIAKINGQWRHFQCP
jgi:hypothetical protein